MDLLRSAYSRISGMAGSLEPMPAVDVTPFLPQQKYELGVLRDNLRMDSPIFHSTLRVLLVGPSAALPAPRRMRSRPGAPAIGVALQAPEAAGVPSGAASSRIRVSDSIGLTR